MSSPRKATLLKFGVFLLLFLAGGAIVNVAVAWGCAYFAPLKPLNQERDSHQLYFFDSSNAWVVVLRTGAGRAALRSWQQPLAGGDDPRSTRRAKPKLPYWNRFGDDVPPETQRQHVAGWPVYALWSSFTNDRSGKRWIPVKGIELRNRTLVLYQTWSEESAIVLPLSPVWPGFAINTVFYAAILWLLWIARRGPGKIRRFVRIRRGRCPACGFIIAPDTCANGLCSECGAKLPQPLRSTTT